MEKALRKFIKTLLLEKYPFILDLYVTKPTEFSKFRHHECYEVFLVFFKKDLANTWGIREYIDELAKYMGVLVCSVYNEIVTEEEWEQIKSHEAGKEDDFQP